MFSGDFRAAPQVGALTPPFGVLRSAAAHLHVPRGGDMFPPDLSCVSGRFEFGRRTRIPPGRCRSPASYRRRARSEPPSECLFLSKSGQRGMAVTQWRGALVKGSGSGVEGPAGLFLHGSSGVLKPGRTFSFFVCRMRGNSAYDAELSEGLSTRCWLNLCLSLVGQLSAVIK